MKHRYNSFLLLIGCLAFIIIGYYFFISTSKMPSYQILINKFDREIPYEPTLIYTDLSAQQFEVFEILNTGLKKQKCTLSGYFEGTISKNKKETYLALINEKRKSEGLLPISSFYSYFETPDYAFITLSEGLHALYMIDLTSSKVFVPQLGKEVSKEIAYTKQYIYHIQPVDSDYYILSGKAQSLDSYLYLLDGKSLELKKVESLTVHPSAISSKQCILSSSGTAFFTHNEAIEQLSLDMHQLLPLSHSADFLLAEEDFMYALGINEEKLHYTHFNAAGELQTGVLTLPASGLQLIDSFIKENWLYTLTFDANHPLYRYYMTVYNLDDHTMSYLSALQTYDTLAPLWIVPKSAL